MVHRDLVLRGVAVVGVLVAYGKPNGVGGRKENRQSLRKRLSTYSLLPCKLCRHQAGISTVVLTGILLERGVIPGAVELSVVGHVDRGLVDVAIVELVYLVHPVRIRSDGAGITNLDRLPLNVFEIEIDVIDCLIHSVGPVEESIQGLCAIRLDSALCR